MLRSLSRITLNALLLASFTIVCSSLVHAWQNKDLIGKWNMVSITPDGDEIPWTLSITYQDGKYSATTGSREGEAEAKDVQIDASTVHLRVPYQGAEYSIDLKLKDNKLVGTWSGNGDSGDTKGEKAATS